MEVKNNRGEINNESKKIIDKVRVWFMPTGWRPDDVKEKYPVKIIENPEEQLKYTRDSSKLLISWSWIQLIITNLFLFHIFAKVYYL